MKWSGLQPPASVTPTYRAAARTGSTRRHSASGEGRAGAWTAGDRRSRGRGGEGSLRPVVGVLSKPPRLVLVRSCYCISLSRLTFPDHNSFHCLRGVPHRLFKFNSMETSLSLLISIMFLIPYQTCVLPQGAQRIVRQERIKCTVPQEKRVLTGPGAQGSRGQFYLCLSGEETPRRASWQR